MNENIKKLKRTLKGEQNKQFSTQRYLQFAGVRNGVLILKDGSVRGVLEVSSVNFNLKSEAEQNAIILAYQRFLNALSFPVQIVMRSYKLDIDQYLQNLSHKKRKLQNQLLKDQMEEYTEYIQKLVEYADIMEKKFFIVVGAEPIRAQQKSLLQQFWLYIHPDDTVEEIIQRRQEFAHLKKTLETRINVVKTAIENCGVKTRELNTEEIISLLYQVYNPDRARTQKLKDASLLAVEDAESMIDETVQAEEKFKKGKKED